MASLAQLTKISELTKHGYKVIGPVVRGLIGGDQMVEAPDGTRYIVDSSGTLTPTNREPQKFERAPDFGDGAGKG